MDGEGGTLWPCCDHCAPDCPTWGKGHPASCDFCHVGFTAPPARAKLTAMEASNPFADDLK